MYMYVVSFLHQLWYKYVQIITYHAPYETLLYM